MPQVGHTGDLEAVIRACTVVDKCLGELLQVVEDLGGRWLIASDHGNADDMVQVNRSRVCKLPRLQRLQPCSNAAD